jgi:ligand-binding sensor domain-containing protein
MKAILTSVFIYFLFSFSLEIKAQNPEWIVFYPWNSGLPAYSVTELAVDTLGNKWIGTGGFGEGGLAVYDDETWTVYDTSNAFIWSYDNFITALAVDKENNVWTATQFVGHPYKFDGINWQGIATPGGSKILDMEVDIYNRVWIGHEGGGIPALIILCHDTIERVFSLNYSNIPSGEVTSIFFENEDTSKVWLGGAGHLMFFNGVSWIDFNDQNSGLPYNCTIYDVIVDQDGKKWLATDQGFIIFSEENWIIYTSQNSDLPEGIAYKLTLDENNNIWLGLSSGGLVKIEGDIWTIYNTSNSPLPNNSVFSLITDKLNNKWIGTMGGLAVHNEIGVQINGLPDDLVPVNVALSIYPNPLRTKGTVKYNCLTTEDVFIGICNLKGNVIHTMINQKLHKGLHVFELNMSSFPTGFYLLKCISGDDVIVKKFLKYD